MNILVLNMGMKSIRSIIYRDDGTKLSSSSKEIRTALNDERVEQDPDEWWGKALQVMQASIRDANVKAIDYITVTTSASCLICADQKGNAIGPCIMVSDKRAVDEAAQIRSEISYKAVSEATGLDVSVSVLLPKILWIKKHQPDVFEMTKYFITPNDYLVCHLCGRIVTDYLNAAKFHYDVQRNTYPLALLGELGIPVNKLPEVVDTGTVVGTVFPNVAETLHIPNGTKVILSSYDAICSFIGSGVSMEGEAADVSGTVTVFRGLSRKEELIETPKVYTIPFRQEKFRIVGGSNNLGGGLIEWVKQCYYMKEEYPYEVMEKEAGESELGARGIIFLPYLLGERAPLWNDHARGVFFGLERMHTRKDMTRAVFESAAFIDRSMIDAIHETGMRINSVRLSGGLARVNLVSQIKADVLGKEVLVLSDFETTAAGAAMMVLQSQAKLSFRELSENFATIRMIVKPNMKNHEKYNVIYELFRDVYETNVPLFDRRIALLKNIKTERETQIENL